ncbi:MAG: histidine phosphatase family protein [Dehalococcoidia bacterium]|nr:histidine phosphatase family protein [Dehalococcoidia bacterium]MYD29970.1 histidine phosphatase family protein [Dehalococcoidia bacterium]
MTLLLVRHGESEGNVEGLIQGQLDKPLTDLGHTQARAVAERLRSDGGVDRIVSSPLARALQTAEAIGAALDLPVTTDDRLMEYDFGELSGLTAREVAERYPGWSWLVDRADAQRDMLPGEEGWPGFDARIAEALAELMALDGRKVVVTHGGVIMAAMNAVMRMHGAAKAEGRRVRFPMKNCGITELARDAEGRLIVLRHNDACHLPADTASVGSS